MDFDEWGSVLKSIVLRFQRPPKSYKYPMLFQKYTALNYSKFLLPKIKNYLFVWTAIIFKPVNRFRRVSKHFKKYSSTLSRITKKL